MAALISIVIVKITILQILRFKRSADLTRNRDVAHRKSLLGKNQKISILLQEVAHRQ